jgi:hypothetical protein
VDARAVAALPTVYAHYDERDVWRALTTTMELFRWLAIETADLLGYPYPSFGAERAAEFTQHLHSSRTHP